MAGRRKRGLKSQCVKLLVMVIRLAFFVPIFGWWNVYSSNPLNLSFSLQTFNVVSSGLNSSQEASNHVDTTNTTTADLFIYFDLIIQNDRLLTGVYYDDLNLNFSLYTNNRNHDFDDNTSSNSTSAAAAAAVMNYKQVVGNYTVGGFHQGSGRTSHRIGHVQTRGMPNWHEVLLVTNSSSSSSLAYYAFRVDLETAVRFKTMAWKGKKRSMMVGADVQVDNITGKNHIELEFDASEYRNLQRLSTKGLFLSVILFWLVCCSPWCLLLLCGGIGNITAITMTSQRDRPQTSDSSPANLV